jgi:hypothetical protein
MRILMLLDTEFPPDIRVENEAQSLLDAGHEVHILSYNFGSKTETEIYKGIHIHRFNNDLDQGIFEDVELSILRCSTYS